jgi:hypothetical protein
MAKRWIVEIELKNGVSYGRQINRLEDISSAIISPDSTLQAYSLRKITLTINDEYSGDNDTNPQEKAYP